MMGDKKQFSVSDEYTKFNITMKGYGKIDIDNGTNDISFSKFKLKGTPLIILSLLMEYAAALCIEEVDMTKKDFVKFADAVYMDALIAQQNGEDYFE